jgi:hypothetical protein
MRRFRIRLPALVLLLGWMGSLLVLVPAPLHAGHMQGVEAGDSHTDPSSAHAHHPPEDEAPLPESAPCPMGSCLGLAGECQGASFVESAPWVLLHPGLLPVPPVETMNTPSAAPSAPPFHPPREGSLNAASPGFVVGPSPS